MSEFQFQYGAIKSALNIASEIFPISFNSNMVRLRVNLPNSVNTPFKFQFQYGAIKSVLKINANGFYFFVSIPIWCD